MLPCFATGACYAAVGAMHSCIQEGVNLLKLPARPTDAQHETIRAGCATTMDDAFSDAGGDVCADDPATCVAVL